MDLAFFFYTVGLIGLALIACSVSVVVHLMTARKDCALAAAGFALYALDLSLIFFDEYSRVKHDYSSTFQEPLTHPLASLALGLAILACLWLWTLKRTGTRVTAARACSLLCPAGLLMLLLLPREGCAGTVQQYLYWLVRDLGIVACLLYAAARYRGARSRAVRLDMERSRGFFALACVLMGCVIIEDTAMILFVRPPEDSLIIGRFFWHLQERNLSENVLMVAVAIQLFRRYREILAVYARHPRSKDIEEGPVRLDVGDIASKIALFADANHLSPREVDVLRLLIRGLDAQNIASELVISPGTVKAHLHRLYSKAGVNSRDALLDAFWRQ